MRIFLLSIMALFAITLADEESHVDLNTWYNFTTLGYGETSFRGWDSPEITNSSFGFGGRKFNDGNTFNRYNVKIRKNSFHNTNLYHLSVGYGWGKINVNKNAFIEILPNLDIYFDNDCWFGCYDSFQENLGISLDINMGLSLFKYMFTPIKGSETKKYVSRYPVGLTFYNSNFNHFNSSSDMITNEISLETDVLHNLDEEKVETALMVIAVAGTIAAASNSSSGGSSSTPSYLACSTPGVREPSAVCREYILQRDYYTCQCDVSYHGPSYDYSLEIDHIIPWSKGGKTSADNLQVLCKYHNRRKSDKLYYGCN